MRPHPDPCNTAALLPTWYDVDDPVAFVTLEEELAG
jgi:hypothetical protein